jgi:hypothetical protein
MRGRIRGGVLLSRLAFVRQRSGEGGLRAILAALSEEDRALLSSLVVAIGWYPFETNERLDAEIARHFGGNAIYRTLGAQSAIDALSTTHKNFVRSRDPHGLLKHIAQLHRLYKDTGYMTYEWLDATSAALRTFDCASYSASDCLTNLGWHEQAIELCGGRNVHAVETRCRSRGDPMCEYTCRWDASTSVRPPRS